MAYPYILHNNTSPFYIRLKIQSTSLNYKHLLNTWVTFHTSKNAFLLSQDDINIFDILL